MTENQTAVKPLTEKRLMNIALFYLERYESSAENLRCVLRRRILRAEMKGASVPAEARDWVEKVVAEVKRLGYVVPDEISICGFTNGIRATVCDPMLTTVEQRGTQVGKEAADVLIGLVEGTLPGDRAEKRIVKTRLVVRGTTRHL